MPAESQNRQPSILIIEDDANLSEMLSAYFSVQDYQVMTTAWGEMGVSRAAELRPDLIILDIHLPDIDGFEVRRRLLAGRKTHNIPVIFLTEAGDRADRLHGLELGVIDYITKPFDVQELRLKVRNILRRTSGAGWENPITGLPEGGALDEALAALGASHPGEVSLIAVSLLGLESFRELYGFVASDDVLRVAALTLAAAVRETGGTEALCGHLDDPIFLIVTPSETTAALIARIIERLGYSLEYFYPAENRGRQARTTDRLRLAVTPLNPDGNLPLRVEELRHRLAEMRREADFTA